MKRIAACGLSALLIAGCSMAPDYERPGFPASSEWPKGEYVDGASSADWAAVGWEAFFRSPQMRGLIKTALDNNRDYRVAALRVEQAQALYRVQRAALLPAVNAGASLTRQGVPANASATGSDLVSSSATANLGFTSFELDLFGRIRSLKDEALEQFFAKEEAQKSARVSLIAETANAYLTYLADKKSLGISKDTFDAQSKTFEIAKHKRELGLGSQLDLEQVRVALETARADKARTARLVAQDRNALELLLGKPLEKGDWDSLTLDTVEISDKLPVGLPSAVLLQRPDVLEAEHALKAANADIGAARAAFFPTIGLTSSAGYASERLSDLFKGGSTLAWTFAPQATLPIFDAGKNMANLEGAEVAQKIAVAQYEKAIQSAFREVADQLAAKGTYGKQSAAQRDAVKAAENANKLSRARYEQGTDSYLTALVALRDLYSARLSETAVRQERLSNLVNLYKALGGGKD